MEPLESEQKYFRAFVCIEVPSEVVKEVGRVRSVLSKVKFIGKMTELENLHLTLKFLGEISAEKIEEVKKKLWEVRFTSFEAKLSEIGTFNYRGKPRIVWIKIGGKGIFELQKKVDESLKEMFAPEERFMSHMTIARVKYVKDKQGFIEYVKGIGVKDMHWKVEKFYLKKSELKPHGPVYSLIEEYSVKK